MGHACLQLILGIVREEARKLPVLAPPGGWQAADLEDLAANFLVQKGKQVTVMLLAQATDDAFVGRLLRKSIQRWLTDQARKTGLVALGRSLEKVLAAEEDFEQVPAGEAGEGRWRLAGSGAAPWSGVVSNLVEAARSVPNVRIPQWSSAKRRAPVADRVSKVALLRAVLSAAGGSLQVSQLCEVLAARFPVVLDPVVVPLDAGSGPELAAQSPTPEQAVLAHEEEVQAAADAAAIVGMLSPLERRMTPLLDDPPGIQEMIGCGRSQAYHHAKRLREKLAQFIGEGEDMRAVGMEVIRLCGAPAETP